MVTFQHKWYYRNSDIFTVPVVLNGLIVIVSQARNPLYHVINATRLYKSGLLLNFISYYLVIKNNKIKIQH